MHEQLSLLDLPPQPEIEPADVTVTDYGTMPEPLAPEAPCAFTAGDVVAVSRLASDGPPMFYGSVIGPAKVDGMVLVEIGIPGNPYCCSESRLTRYDGVVSLWRLGEAVICDRPDCQPKQSAKPFTCSLCEARSQSHWWYVGHMADGPRTPRWPDAVWFPASYDPNTRSFE